MKQKWFMMAAIVLAVALVGFVLWQTVFSTEPPVDDVNADSTTNTFTGVVTSVSDGGMLMDCETDQFTEVWVSLINCPEVTPAVGERYEVTHTGEVLETYPPQATAVSVTLLGVASTTASAATEPEDVVIPGTLTFTGKVLELDGESVLMECYDKDKFDTVWVYYAQTGVSPKAGEEYAVIYEDVVMPSLPPRITAVEMTQP